MKPIFRVDRDRNGNRIVRIIPAKARGFSIQTNGNLLRTHAGGYSSDYTPDEVRAYVRKYGTARQKAIMGEL